MKVLVQTKNGDKGIADLSRPLNMGKREVIILAADLKTRIDNRLCDPLTLRVIGYVD